MEALFFYYVLVGVGTSPPLHQWAADHPHRWRAGVSALPCAVSVQTGLGDRQSRCGPRGLTHALCQGRLQSHTNSADRVRGPSSILMAVCSPNCCSIQVCIRLYASGNSFSTNIMYIFLTLRGCAKNLFFKKSGIRGTCLRWTPLTRASYN